MDVLFYLLFICFMTGVTADSSKFSDYNDHPCKRECQDDGKPMTCVYDFTLEYYYTLSKACYDCPRNITDCYRPHCVPADGVSRSIITVNRMLPGPGIHVCENDEIVVNVHNNLETGEGTTIHWHGILQIDSQWNDGVPMVTQCPIVSRTTFQYKFRASNPGTHFWHAHTGVQRADGVYGNLVVRQPPKSDVHWSLYDHDLPEHTMVVNDWLNQLTIDRFAAHHHNDGDNKPRLMLINGRNNYKEFKYDDTPDQIFKTPNEVFKVKMNETYRFRVASNAIFNCPLQISIDDHTMTVIASDGSPFDPVVVDSFNIFAGERFDFVLHATQDPGNYWFRVRGMADCGESQKQGQAFAIIRYEGASEEQPSASSNYLDSKRGGMLLNPWNEKATETKLPVTKLNALIEDFDGMDGTPDKKFYVTFDFNKLDNFHFNHPELYPLQSINKNKHLYSPQMNGISNHLPSSPPLTQFDDISEEMYCNVDTVKNKNCSREFCQCVHRLVVDLNDVVEIILIDEGVTFNANHPTHLHGHTFRVVGMGKLNVSTSLEEVMRLDREGLIERKLSKAVAKDTVTVPDGGYTVIRFHANNPGMWFFHCHIEFHVEIGMGLLIQVGSKDDMPKRPKGFPTCGNYQYHGDEEPATPYPSSSISFQCNIAVIFLSLVFFLFH
ncbi:hypothetical protein LOTGIDRAFT_231844 [Lottia gigantea]|uniref:Uncharacterized protein n=1 Tax=Lottia gigantea TaxID=225164 RepID=V4AR19_LOTGI|nr:hypothetical protein LOTGIDRAFT_231844 [Lottia gigantea]ESO96136.1 hypothetical protein LOTGIDRAFT_231844 [Lottia gigantea]